MEVKGIRKEIINVDIEPKEMILALSRYFKVNSLFEETIDSYSRLEKEEGKHIIVHYENISYHGSPHYIEKSKKELLAEQHIAANSLKQIMDIIKEQEKHFDNSESNYYKKDI